MKITFLGTSCMVPTKDRNHQGVLLTYKNQGLLFDCGEGVQRQFRIAGIKHTKVTKIFISHWHGDHVFGLPGFLNTLSASGFEGTLELYGPKGSKKFYEYMLKAFKSKIIIEIKVIECEKGKIFENDDFIVESYPLEHNTPTLGYRFIEKDKLRINMVKAKKLGLKQGPIMGKLQEGKDITFEGKKINNKDVTYLEKGKIVGIINDTLFCENTLKIAKDADVLISESTYAKDNEAKAEEYNHITSEQAATIASKANAKRLILTHFSQRYKDVNLLVEEAKVVFPKTEAAYDFMKVKI